MTLWGDCSLGEAVSRAWEHRPLPFAHNRAPPRSGGILARCEADVVGSRRSCSPFRSREVLDSRQSRARRDFHLAVDVDFADGEGSAPSWPTPEPDIGRHKASRFANLAAATEPATALPPVAIASVLGGCPPDASSWAKGSVGCPNADDRSSTWPSGKGGCCPGRLI